MIIQINKVNNGYIISVDTDKPDTSNLCVVEESSDAEAEAAKIGFVVLKLLAEKQPNEQK